MVAVIGAAVALIALKEPIFPVPLAGRPMAGLLFVQVCVVPVTELEKLTAEVAVPLQTTWFTGCVNTVVGLTVMVNVLDGPGQVTEPVV